MENVRVVFHDFVSSAKHPITVRASGHCKRTRTKDPIIIIIVFVSYLFSFSGIHTSTAIIRSLDLTVALKLGFWGCFSSMTTM